MLSLPETKALRLEELDQVFSVPTRKRSSYQLKKIGRGFKRHISRQKVEPWNRSGLKKNDWTGREHSLEMDEVIGGVWRLTKDSK